jgi:hypothetical protein
MGRVSRGWIAGLGRDDRGSGRLTFQANPGSRQPDPGGGLIVTVLRLTGAPAPAEAPQSWPLRLA